MYAMVPTETFDFTDHACLYSSIISYRNVQGEMATANVRLLRTTWPFEPNSTDRIGRYLGKVRMWGVGSVLALKWNAPKQPYWYVGET
jgi:hypothetical protein